MTERESPSGPDSEVEREAEPQRSEEHSEKPKHEHSSEESWSTPRWGPLLDEHDSGTEK